MTVALLEVAQDIPDEPEELFDGLTSAELKAKHGELTLIRSPRGPLIFKKPTEAVYADYVDNLARDKGSKSMVMKRLALACVVFPPLKDASELLTAYPGLVLKANGVISALAGAEDEGGAFDIKKL